MDDLSSGVWEKKGVLLVADEGIWLCSKVTNQKMEAGGEIVVSFG